MSDAHRSAHTAPDGAVLDDARAVAIVGMAGRFPGAPDLDAYWRLLIEGREGITRFTDEALRAAGVDAATLADSAYVRANGVLDGIDRFDAGFFGMPPLEAEITDPQHRLFLECAWHALEHAGYHPHGFEGRIGVFAGAGFSTYLLHNLLARPDILARVAPVQLSIANNKDYVPTRVSYKLDLKGPSINVNTACSSSLVAVHLACQSLLDYHADMVLAGGVGIQVPQHVGYRYETGGIASPDGHCRPFDARAQGTVSGNGVGVVVLKRLTDALESGDTIHAIIRGSAVNNDGAAKVGYTAPSVDGQAEVIAEALAVAAVEPDSIQYIETHGTGTPVGDPIEIAALTQAFRLRTARSGFCAIGSVKSNVGHLDEAAGVAGLIKTVLALEHGAIPPSLHFTAPNPEIDFSSTPFVVNASARPWESDGPRRAGVSAFGIGGTNAHVVLEQAPAANPESEADGPQVLALSARSAEALAQQAINLAAHLRAHPDVPLADVAWTLQQGRRAFDHRRVIVATDRLDAVARLESADVATSISGRSTGAPPRVAFLFPGQGTQFVGMGRGLYDREPLFRADIDRCASLLQPALGLDIRGLLHGGAPGSLTSTRYAQPALFAIEYATARLWMSWGIEPYAMLGHSLGELVAATLAGVFALEDALALVAARAALMHALPAGAMAAVPLGATELEPLLGDDLSIAAINAPARTVVSGPVEAVDRLSTALAARGIETRRLETSHAFHSRSMDAIRDAFAERVSRVARHAPERLWMSNLTGVTVTAAQAVDPAYWASHLREPVRFAHAAQQLLQDPGMVFLEAGPGRTLTTLVRMQPGGTGRVFARSLRHADEATEDTAMLADGLARLWTAGAKVDWAAVHRGERRRRVPLPGYPFARQRYWVEPAKPDAAHPTSAITAARKSDVGQWLYVPSWTRALPPHADADAFAGRTVVVPDAHGVGARLIAALRDQGHDVVDASASDAAGLVADDTVRIIDCSTLDAPADIQRQFEVCRAIAAATRDIALVVVTDLIEDVTGAEPIDPAKAAMAGPLMVLPQERPGVTCRTLDITGWRADDPAFLTRLLVDEIGGGSERAVAWRHGHRWVRALEPVTVAAEQRAPIRQGGSYLITGGLGGVGLILAEHLATRYGAKVALTGRSASAVETALASDPGIDAEKAGATAFAAREARLAGAIAEARRALAIKGIDAYPGLGSAIDRLCASHVLALAGRAGLRVQPGATFDVAELKSHLGIVAPLARMGDYFRQVLEDDGLLAREGTGLVFTAAAGSIPPPAELHRAAVAAYPRFTGMFELLEHCVAHYPDALSGRIPAISVLYPDGEATRLEQAAANTAAHSTRDIYIRAVRELLLAELRARGGRTLRVLEIGVGDGLLAGVLAPALRDLPVEYHATDIGRTFVQRAEQSAAAAGLSPIMRFGTLDISRDPASQGFAPGSFDVVLALDVLHATADLPETLTHARRLLAPGGVAAIVETMQAPRWVDFIWGLAEGWWAFRDGLRTRQSPLLRAAEWRDAFRQAGFAHVAAWPAPDGTATGDFGLVVGQVGGAEPHAVRTVRRLRAAGTEVLVLEADVADEPAMRTALDTARTRFGRIDGVIHAAGVTAREIVINPIEATEPAQVDALLRPKAGGATVLATLLADEPLDFILLISSNASILGGLGLSAYAAASRYLDAYAAARRRTGDRRWISSNWDGWPNESEGGFDSGFQTSIDRYAMSLAECRDAFERVLSAGVPQVVVSAGDLQTRLRRWVQPAADASSTPGESATAPSLDAASADNAQAAAHARPETGSAFEAPESEAERAIAGIWEALLGIHPIGVTDAFADLGGDSLLGTQLIARVERRFGHRMPFRALFEAPTVRAQARLIETLTHDARSDAPIPTLPDAASYPLSHAQRRLWVLTQLEGSAAYNIPLHQRLTGPLDVPALERALSALVQRHEVLRTRIVTIDGEPRQQVDPPAAVSLRVIDLTADPDREAAAQQLAREDAAAAFDLTASPLRVSLVRLAADRHVLLFTVHHIACDGVSIGILGSDLAALYLAARNGAAPPLPALRVQYRDYAGWQQAQLESGGLSAQRDYWLAQLGAAPVLDLPLDAPRPAVQTFRGREAAWHLEPDAAQRVSAAARAANVSLFMLLGACVKVLLHRYTGEQDIVVGTPVAGRVHPDLDGQAGFYLNMLALRDTVRPGDTFTRLLDAVRTTATSAYDHQAYPFDRLVDELDLPRDLSRSPVFDVIVILQNQQESALALEGLESQPCFDHNGTSKADLTFNFKESARGLAIGIEFNTDLFAEARIARMGGHLLRILDAVTEDPHQTIGALPLLTPDETTALATWNATATPYPSSATVLSLARAVAAESPDRAACRCDGASLTYEALFTRASAWAAALSARGIVVGDVVGVHLDRAIELLPVLLGIHGVGAAYVPLDPAFPADRLRYMVEDSGARMILTTATLAADWEARTGPDTRLLPLDALSADAAPSGAVSSGTGAPVAASPNAVPAAAVRPGAAPPGAAHSGSARAAQSGDLAYLLYTSGSTGKPKGVAIEHRALVNFLTAMRREPGLGAGDVLLAVTTLSFDIAGLELFLPLVCGAQVVIATREAASDGVRLQALLRESGATVMQATPATWQMLLESGWPGDPALTVLCGGEALPFELASRLARVCRRVWNLYGPTETTIWSSVADASAAVDRVAGNPGAAVAIGHPIANTTLHVLDAALQPVPVGVAGELFIGGDGLARGYVGLPALTADRFIPDPFAARLGARMYRTGDRVARRAEGDLEFLGRFDDQIKLRGFRIEVGEIENALLGHPQVAAAAVVLQQSPLGPRLMAAVVSRGGVDATDTDTLVATLRQHLLATLPDYMVPGAFAVMASLPRTANGKIDRTALRAHVIADGATTRPRREPATPTERRLAAVWADVLELPGVGADDDFFQLGGHSLKGARLAFRVNEETGVLLTLAEVFQHPTVESMARRVDARSADADAHQPRRDAIPLAPLTPDELDLLNE